MAKISQNFGTSVHTLGQLPPDPSNSLVTLRKRARSKWYTQAIVGRLLYQNSPLHRYYQRAYYCNHELTQEGLKITGKFCDTRVCHICNRIRTAKMMNGYISQFVKFDYLEFVTLSVRSVTGNKLRETITEMRRVLTLIIRHFREKLKLDISGVIKIEVTYNLIEDWYHPHIHLIVTGKVGNLFVQEWLKRFPDTSSFKGQDCREADPNALNEIFKYQTKIIVGSKDKLLVHIPALDTIMVALKGKRTFQPFGSIRKVAEDINGIQSQEYQGIKEYPFVNWIWEDCDWVLSNVTEMGRDTLTGYIPPDIQIQFVE
jgi:hypothetical protein